MVRQSVLDRVLKDNLNLSTVQKCMRQDLLLELSTRFLFDCLEHAFRQFDDAGVGYQS